MEMPDDGRSRVVVAAVEPVVDAGRHPAKAEVGLPVRLAAQVIVDGHDRIRVVGHWLSPEEGRAQSVEMEPGPDDWWSATIVPEATGLHHFAIEAGVDRFQSWRQGVEALAKAGTLTPTDVAVGAVLLEEALGALGAAGRRALRPWVARLGDPDLAEATRAALHPDLRALAARFLPLPFPTRSDRYPVQVDPLRARFSAWYECFPRSTSPEPNRAGTLRDLRARLPYIAGMGFDVLYIPPIHPIGITFRKGPNNTLEARPGDPGSPWAIGNAEGGHDAIHPDLGSFADFAAFVSKARDLGLEVALDLALQASPDHPWVKEHPEWFTTRADGSIAYAENPPKRYQDIYPLNFDNDPEGIYAEISRIV